MHIKLMSWEENLRRFLLKHSHSHTMEYYYFFETNSVNSDKGESPECSEGSSKTCGEGSPWWGNHEDIKKKNPRHSSFNIKSLNFKSKHWSERSKEQLCPCCKDVT